MSDTTDNDRARSQRMRVNRLARGRPAAVMGALFLILPAFLVFAPWGLTVWLALGMFALPPLMRWPQLANWRAGPMTVTLSVLLLWSGFSLAWSPDADLSRLWNLLAVSAIGAFWFAAVRALEMPERIYVQARLMIGFVFAILLLTLESVTSLQLGMWLSGDFDQDRRLVSIAVSCAALVSVGWVPLILIAQDELSLHRMVLPVATLVVIFVLLANFLFFDATAAIGGLLSGFVVFFLVLLQRRIGVAVLGLGVVLYVVLAPVLHVALDLQQAPPDAAAAILLGEDDETARPLAARIFERPVIGHGLGSLQQDMGGEGPRLSPAMSKNGILKTWYELGLIGALCLAALTVAILMTLTRPLVREDMVCTRAALFASVAFMTCLGFNIWDPWNMAAVWLSVGVIGLLDAGTPSRAPVDISPA